MSTAEAFAAAKSRPVDDDANGSSFWLTAIKLAMIAQAERIVGIGVAFSSRWFLGPADLGVYSGLRLLLDNTNRSSLGVALGAIQKSVALKGRRLDSESDRVLAVAATTNTLTASLYGGTIAIWGLAICLATADWRWGMGMAIVGMLAIVKRQQDFRIAVLRGESNFSLVGRVNFYRNLAFGLSATTGILACGFWGLIGALCLSFLVERAILHRECQSVTYPTIWDFRTSVALALTGLPILAANSAWACVTTLDRALILANLNGGTKLAGYYSIAVLGCGILEDFASRAAMMLSTSLRSEFGRDGSTEVILQRAESTGMAILGVMAPAGAVLAHGGAAALPAMFPNLAPGTEALTPMIPGTIALCAAMPLREAWISAERPWIPTIVSALGAAILLLRVSKLGANASIADVAFAASLCRVATSLAMFALPAILLKWNPARFRRWAAILLWASCWFGAFPATRNQRPDMVMVVVITLATTAALAAAYWRVVRNVNFSASQAK